MKRTLPTPRATGSRPAAAKIRIVRTAPEHARAVARVIRRAHGLTPDEPCPGCPTPGDVRRQVRRFGDGQFVALDVGGPRPRVVGAATTMRTSRPPTAPPLSWARMSGGPSLPNHEPKGAWLYGLEMAVDPDAQGRGIGSALYRRRQALVRELRVEGLYAGGLLKGYARHRDRMSVREYADRVRRGDLVDPTVTMQMRRGFVALAFIADYDVDEPSGDGALLIVWRPGPRRGRELSA